MKKISIILPVYNVPAEFLRASLNSVLMQAGEDIEILIIDDGSTDASSKICDEYEKKDPRISLIHQENMGLAGSRNTGLDMAEGEYIIFVDSDDLLCDKLVCEKMYQYAKKENIDIGFFNNVNTFNKNIDSAAIQKYFQGEEIRKRLQLSIIMQKEIADGIVLGSAWAKIYKNSFLKEHQLKFDIELRRTQDRAFLVECLTKNPKVAYFNLLAYEYTVTNYESLTNKYNARTKYYFEKLIKRIRKVIYKNYQVDQEFKTAIHQMCCKLFFDCLYTDMFNRDNKKSFKERYFDYRRLLADDNYKTAICQVNRKEFIVRQQLILLCIRKKLYFISALILEGIRSFQRLKYANR